MKLVFVVFFVVGCVVIGCEVGFCHFGQCFAFFYLFDFFFRVGVNAADAGDDVVALSEIDYAYSLSSSAHQADVGYMETYGDAALIDDYDVVAVVYSLEAYETACLIGDVHRLNAFAASVGDAVRVKLCALAVAFCRYYHNAVGAVGGHAYHAHYGIVVAVEAHAAHAGAHSSHGAERCLMEPDGASAPVGKQDFRIAVGEFNAYQAVALAHDDGFFAFGHYTGIFCE